MRINEFVKLYESKQDHYFFSQSTLQFFGERTSDMKVRLGSYTTDSGQRPAYLVSTWQRKHPLGPRYCLHTFDAETLERIRSES